MQNNLTTIEEHAFDKIDNLQDLTLAFNPINNLAVRTFYYLWNLRSLSLANTNISTIPMGTFTHQHQLIWLNLSGIRLKKIDFELFFPIFRDLNFFYLFQKELTDLNGFRNAIFPQLEFLDIRENQFNCSYLRRFLENIDWTKLHMPIYPEYVKNKISIHGISCKNISISSQSNAENTPESNTNFDIEIVGKNDGNGSGHIITQLKNPIEVTSKSFQQFHDDLNYIEVLLVSVCICIILLISLITILSWDQIYVFLKCKKLNHSKNKFTNRIVEYENDQLL